MLKWDEVRRLIVSVTPSIQHLGFNQPGRTMRRFRKDFVDVIDFRCANGGGRVIVDFGCEVRGFARQNQKPWECTFCFRAFDGWHTDLLKFKESREEQIAALATFAPLFVAETERWFALLPDLQAARRAVDRKWFDPSRMTNFNVPSPAYYEAVRRLDTVIADEALKG